MTRLVILISGRGSNMEALFAADLPVEFAAVISNKVEATGLKTAAARGIQTVVMEHTAYADRAAFDAALMAEIDRHRPDLVVLAGFMRVLTDPFVTHYTGRLLNVHPALLPAFPGLHTHERALAAGVKVHGCTVHFVTPEVDVGPIVIQAAVPVLDSDTVETLGARVLTQEHRIYPQAIRWFAEGQLSITAAGRVHLGLPREAMHALVSPPLDE